MISQTSSSAVRSAYANTLGETKSPKTNAGVRANKQEGLSRVEQLKESITSGEYKINLDAVAKKMADELI